MAKKFWEREGFSIEAFAQIFGGVYDLYYNAPHTETDEDAMCRQGDELLRDRANKPLLSMLAGYRQDILTSDREVAAFALTYQLYKERYS